MRCAARGHTVRCPGDIGRFPVFVSIGRLSNEASGSDVSTLAWSSAKPMLIYAGLVPGPGQILQSLDGGSSWHSVTAGLNGREGVMAIASPQLGRATVLMGSMGRRVWRLEQGARRWRFSGAGLPSGQHGASLLLTSGVQYVGTMGAGIAAQVASAPVQLPPTTSTSVPLDRTGNRRSRNVVRFSTTSARFCAKGWAGSGRQT